MTNPPFSLFRDFVAQLIKYHNEFLIIGNQNAFTYKEIFPLLQEDKMRTGYYKPKEFIQPNGTTKKFGNICWYTNLDVQVHHYGVDVWHTFDQTEDLAYDNYTAFNINKVIRIPKDMEIDATIPADKLEAWKQVYKDDLDIINESTDNAKIHINRPIWGVPITFFDSYNPEQFKILGAATAAKDLAGIAWINDGRPAHPIVQGKKKYARILIRPIETDLHKIRMQHESN